MRDAVQVSLILRRWAQLAETPIMQPHGFGNRLRAFRESRGLSVRELARRVRCDHTQIVRWEKLTRAPKQISLERLAAALNCAVLDLLSGGDENATGITPVTKMTPMSDDRADELARQLDTAAAERDRLRTIVVEMADAIRDRANPERAIKLRMRVLEEAAAIESRAMLESVESIE